MPENCYDVHYLYINIHRQIDRQTDRQIDRWIDIDRQIDSQVHLRLVNYFTVAICSAIGVSISTFSNWGFNYQVKYNHINYCFLQKHIKQMIQNVCEKFQLFIKIDVFKKKYSSRKKMKLICSSSPRNTSPPLLIRLTP